MKDILVVLPFVETAEVVEMTERYYADTGADVAGIEEGKHPLITYADIEHNTPALVERIVRGERQGYRAAVVGCFGDPGLTGARELTSFPVIGPGETTLAVASTLGDRILLVEPDRDSTYATERMVKTYGFENRVVRVMSLDIVGGDDYIDHSAGAALKVAETCFEAARSLNAHVMILGCIGFGLMIEEIRGFFRERGVSMPVIEPGITAIEYAGMLLRTGYNESRVMFSNYGCSPLGKA